MIFGRAYHVAMLEPNEFDEKVKVFNSATRTTKGYKDFKADNPKTPNVNEAYESPSFLEKNWKGLLGAVVIVVIGFIIGSYNK